MGRQGVGEGRIQLEDEAVPHRLGELLNDKDVASPEEWGHAAIAPDENPPRQLGMFPWTP